MATLQRYTLWTLLFIFAATTLCACISEDEQTSDQTTLVSTGEMAPDFSVEMTDGSTVTLSKLKGKCVILTFLDPVCPTCQELMALTDESIIKRTEGLQIEYLPIARGCTKQQIADYCSTLGYDFAIGADPDKSIYSLYATKYVPRSFIIDKKGMIRNIFVEFETADIDSILAAAKKIAAE